MKTYLPPTSNEGINCTESLWIISVDLGQANDYTAISIFKRTITGYGVLGYDRKGKRQIDLVHLERTRNVEYPAIVERIKDIYHSEALKHIPKAVVIDYTGLGRPVFDMMKEHGFDLSLNGISITSGNDVTYHGSHYNVPKRDLVSKLQIEMQNGELRIAKGLKEANTLIEELANFRTTITNSGNDTYNGRSGVHDDLVLSVAMGVWLACRDRIRRIGDDKHI